MDLLLKIAGIGAIIYLLNFFLIKKKYIRPILRWLMVFAAHCSKFIYDIRNRNIVDDGEKFCHRKKNVTVDYEEGTLQINEYKCDVSKIKNILDIKENGKYILKIEVRDEENPTHFISFGSKISAIEFTDKFRSALQKARKDYFIIPIGRNPFERL